MGRTTRNKGTGSNAREPEALLSNREGLKKARKLWSMYKAGGNRSERLLLLCVTHGHWLHVVTTAYTSYVNMNDAQIKLG